MSTPIARWPDAPGSPVTLCGGCEASYGVYAAHPKTKRPSGRPQCPHCGKPRPLDAVAKAESGKWLALVERGVKFGRTCGLDREAAYDAAVEGYMNAAVRWAPAVAKFSTFAGLGVRFAVLSAVRKQRSPNRCKVRTVDPAVFDLASSDGPDADLAAVLQRADAEDPWSTDELEEVNDAAVEILDRRSRRIVKLRYRDGLTLAAIGAKLKVSKQRVAQLLTRVVETLREHLREDDDADDS